MAICIPAAQPGVASLKTLAVGPIWTARNSGKGGNIDVSSGEGTHEISGQLVTRGENGGGDMRVSSRSGINIHEDALLHTLATGSDSGGNVRLFVSEGELNHDGKVLSEGGSGGNIDMNASDVNLAEDSILQSRGFEDGGGNIKVQANNTIPQ